MKKRVTHHKAGVPIYASAVPDATAGLKTMGSGSVDRLVIGIVAAPRGRWMLLLAALIFLLATGGCQLLETREADESPPPAPPPAPVEPEPEPEPEPADLSTAMAHLEAGRGDKARQVLVELAGEAPGSRVLASLLRQIDEPAEQLLPGPYRRLEVAPGESLSLIAARELGDPLMFYALARLNGIEVPARIPAGTILRVPEAMDTGDSPEPVPAEDTEVPAGVPVLEVESVAEYLARSGQNDQARAMLIAQLDQGGGIESTRELLVRLTLEHAAQLSSDTGHARAMEVIDETLAVIDAPERRSALAGERDRIQADMLRNAALRLRDEGRLPEAYETATRAASLMPDDTAPLVDGLRAELVDSLHNEALIAWRERNVDLAIRTWESLLAVAPDFEPARVYLERARLLRKRLDEP